MNILYFADTRFPIERANGLQTMATCQALAARGHGVTLVTRPDTQAPARDPFEYYGLPRTPGLTIEPVTVPKGVKARRVAFLLSGARRLLTTRADVILTRDLGIAAFLLRVPAVRRPPIVYESHGIAPVVSAEMAALLGKPGLAASPGKVARLDRRERRVWEQARAYVTITRALADELTSRYGARDHVFVVPDGARLPARQPGTENPGRGTPDRPGTPLAGYAGHLYPWKGVDVFLHALALAPRVRGIIVGGHPGEADLERVTGLVHELQLDDRVEITGLVRPGEVAARLSAATMVVLPNARSAISERYTSPLKLFEYLAMGRPIVASDLPALREILTDGTTALLVAPGDPQALAQAMTRLAQDAALSDRLGRAGAALAPAYTWDARAVRLEAALAATQ